MKSSSLGLLLALAPLLFGCPQDQTTIELQNDAGGELSVTVFYSSNQDIPEEALEEAQSASFVIAAGECRKFSRDCDVIQAVKIEADVDLGAGLGPSGSSDVFRDGTDFGCGDILHYTFTSTVIPPALTIDYSQRSGDNPSDGCTE